MENVHVEELINALMEARQNSLRSHIKPYPRNQFIASDISECDRYMVYSVLNWQDRIPQNEWLQALFESGREEERKVIRDLLQEGFEVVEGQALFDIKHKGKVICRGSIDCKIKYKGRKFPAEIKSMDGNIFRGIKTIDDFQKRPYLRKYLRQIQMYLYGHNEEEGLFILTDCRGHYIYIPVYLDYGECERILKYKLEKNWEHIENKTYPDKLLYDSKYCEKCPFAHICLPDRENQASEFIDDPELESILERREELLPYVDEFADLDEIRKEERFRNNPETFVGTNWHIISSKRKGTRLDTKAIPEEVKKDYLIPTETVTVKIFKLEGVKNDKSADNKN